MPTVNRCLSAESIVVFSRMMHVLDCFFEGNFVLSIFLLIMFIFKFILYNEILAFKMVFNKRFNLSVFFSVENKLFFF